MLTILLLTVQALVLSTGDPTVPETEPDIGKLIEHIEKQIQHVQGTNYHGKYHFWEKIYTILWHFMQKFIVHRSNKHGLSPIPTFHGL